MTREEAIQNAAANLEKAEEIIQSDTPDQYNYTVDVYTQLSEHWLNVARSYDQ